MTPEHDFAGAKEGYSLSWADKYRAPREYAVFGWAKAH